MELCTRRVSPGRPELRGWPNVCGSVRVCDEPSGIVHCPACDARASDATVARQAAEARAEAARQRPAPALCGGSEDMTGRRLYERR